jgi:hypothetical protein
MSEQVDHGKEEIHSKVLRAGRRTYFFDVRATKADDYYLTITESKKHTSENGSSFYKKHKIYLYKEDFDRFKDILTEITDFIVSEKGEEVISDTHQPDFHANTTSHIEEESKEQDMVTETVSESNNSFTDIQFEDI